MLKIFTLAALMAMVPLTHHFTTASAKRSSGKNDFFKAHPLTFKNTAATSFFETKHVINTVDTAVLKQSSWYAAMMNNIEAGEYNISLNNQTQQYASPNRRQNLRGYYNNREFTVTPRNDSADKWKLSLTLKGVFAGRQLLMAPVENAAITQNGSTIQFNNNNAFTTEYINNKEGIRQNFIIQQQPLNNPKKISIRLQANKGWVINKAGNTEIHFAKATKSGYQNKLTYNDLKVWDANHKTLDASFSVKENTISIDVDTKNAVYPVTVDPLSTGTAGTVDWTGNDANQINSYYGISIASAGDVNGDGYSDVIVGSHYYDDGPNTDEGRAFVYYGSAAGLSATPNSTPDDADQAGAYFGISVASAGDVNGDGFSDVVIGASGYTDAGNASEGRAFVYYGSAAGLSASPDRILDDANKPNAFFGISVACAGDVNGDGFSDVIIGAYGYDDGLNLIEGRAFVYYGHAAGLSATPDSTPDDADQAGARFGVWVAGAGDVNGDGFSDVIIGAHFYDDGANTDEGRAFVYYGSAGGISASPNSTPDDADQTAAYFGRSVATAGDVNGDGYSDVIIGAFGLDDGANADEGGAFVYYGSAAGLSATPNSTPDDANQAGANFGWCVTAAGDVNGDGFSDIIIGAPFYDDGGNADEGRAFVYYGNAAGLAAAPVSTPDDADQPGANFGWCVAAAGDVNGDGYSDVAIGVPFYNDAANTDEGRAFAYYGNSNGLSAAQTNILNPVNQNLAGIGNSVSGAGDVNGDGYSDIVIGAPNYDDGTADEGRAWVYYGHATGLSASPDVILDDANQAGASFGYSVAGAGDVNGDGYSDVIVGAYNYSGGNSNEGRAWVHYGNPSGLSLTANVTLDDANQDGAGFGNSVAAAGDVNGDGYGDVIVGARYYDNGGNTDEGQAFLYYGSAAGLSVSPGSNPNDANQLGANFGVYVAGAGDVNGDGYSDIIIGASGYDGSAGANEGRAYVYYGGISGLSLSPNRTLSDAGQAGAAFGIRVTGVGDVNGDGFADVVVTGILFDASKGRAWLYYGHATTGLSATPDVILDNNSGNAGDYFGYGVSSAGDVNGDGYNDVMIGIPQYDNPPFSEDGRVFVYYGGAAGLSSIPSIILRDATEDHEFFGISTACAGDINGDGYSDVIIGADHGSWSGAVGGRAFLHNGNELIANKRNNLQMYNSDLTTLINNTNFISSNFGAGLYAKSFLGRTKGKMVWETRINYHAYSGTPFFPITNSTFYTAQQAAYTDLGLAGAELKDVVNKLGGGQIYTKLRARVKYDPVTAITGQVYGPWRYISSIIDANKLGALPIELISFKAAWLQKGKTAEIHFVTDKEAGICCFNIEKSSDGFNFSSIGTLTAKNTGSRQLYNFTDINASGSKQFYRLKITGTNSKTEYSNIEELNFNGSRQIWLFPNPAHDVLQLQVNGNYNSINIQIANSAGQTVQQLHNMAVANATISIPVSSLPAGQYWLKLQAADIVQVLQFIKQ